jgi:Transposase IS200 like
MGEKAADGERARRDAMAKAAAPYVHPTLSAAKPQWEFPRLCRGGSKSLTYPAVDTVGPSTKLRIVSSQAHEEEFHRWMTMKVKSQQVGVQIPRRPYSEVPQEDLVPRTAPASGRCGEKKRNFVGQHFWARGYFVSTVGGDTEVIREYTKKQEEEDKRLEQMEWR